jgi:hypothetical protein
VRKRKTPPTKAPESPAISRDPLTPPSLLQSAGPVVPLTQEQQEIYLQLLSRGASPAAACLQSGLSLPDVAASIEHDEAFRHLLSRVNELLSQNVAAALYRSAMEGSVSAQTFFLKNMPPPEWPTPDTEDQPRNLVELTDEELITQFRKEAPALLARLASGDTPPTGASPAGPLS